MAKLLLLQIYLIGNGLKGILDVVNLLLERVNLSCVHFLFSKQLFCLLRNKGLKLILLKLVGVVIPFGLQQLLNFSPVQVLILLFENVEILLTE